MVSKRKTARKAVHKITTPKSKKSESVMFWKMIFVGAIAALVVSAGFNYVQPKISDAEAATASQTLYYWVNADSGSDTNTGSKTKPFKTLAKSFATINGLVNDTRFKDSNVKLYLTPARNSYTTCDFVNNPDTELKDRAYLYKSNVEITSSSGKPTLNCGITATANNFKISNLKIVGGDIELRTAVPNEEAGPVRTKGLIKGIQFSGHHITTYDRPPGLKGQYDGTSSKRYYIYVSRVTDVTITGNTFSVVNDWYEYDPLRDDVDPDQMIYIYKSPGVNITSNTANASLGNQPTRTRYLVACLGDNTTINASKNTVTGYMNKYRSECKGNILDR